MPAFISEWKTDNAGTSNDDQITLPLVSSGTYDFTVDWGDGSQDTITSHDDAAVTHTYAAAGTYTVEITGTISGWQFDDGGDKDKILDVSQWGDLAFGVNENHFYGCSNLDVSATDAPDLTGVTSLRSSFRGSGIDEADLSQWDVSSVTTMQGMFQGTPFNGDISAWDVSSVTNMREMFQDSSFNGDLSQWDVSSVTGMVRMFEGSSFNGDVSAWDVSSVTDMSEMFRDSSFNGDISAWDVSSVTNMQSMLRDLPFNGDVSAWDVSSVTNMRTMFRDSPFSGDLSQWDVSSVTTMRSMFQGASFNGDISTWDVSSVTTMQSMFLSGGISDENYSRALIAWSQLPLEEDVTFDNTPAEYYEGAAAEARAKIATDFNWTIGDEGENTEDTSYAVVGQALDGATPLVEEPVVWTSEQDVELDAVTSALHGAQEGRFAVMTTDSLTFPNDSDVNGTTVTLEETTFIYEQDVGPESVEVEATIHGTVTDDVGAVTGIDVNLRDDTQTVVATTQTDANGDFSFTEELEEGTYEVHTNPTHYEEYVDSFSVVEGTENYERDATLTLSPGVITDIVGDPAIEGADVEAWQMDGTPVGTTTTDTNGRFYITGGASGNKHLLDIRTVENESVRIREAA